MFRVESAREWRRIGALSDDRDTTTHWATSRSLRAVRSSAAAA